MADTRDVSVIIAPPSQRPILDALLDLSAAGEVAPFTWIEAPEDPAGAPDAADPRALAAESGRLSASTFSRRTSLRGVQRARILVLVPAGHPAQDALAVEAENFYQGLPLPAGAERTLVRIVVPWSAQDLPAAVGRAGWHGVVLSPESTAEPAFPGVPWWTAPERIPGAAALAIAVQAGILRGSRTAPMDARSQGLTSDAEIVRTFARRVDADAVEGAIRERVLHLEDEVPTPTRPGGTYVEQVASPAGAVREAADRWGAKHESAIRRPRAAVPEVAGQRIRFLEAIALFLDFMLRALVSAPENWLRRTLRSAQTSVAARTTSALFGPESDISVVAGGVSPDGTTASWQEIRDAAAHADVGARERSAGQGAARQSFAELWDDMLEGGRGLLDGSRIGFLSSGSTERYVPSRSLVAPPVDGDGSYRIVEPIGSLPGDLVLHAWDALTIARVRADLERTVRTSGPAGQTAARHLSAIDAWQQRTRGAFVPMIGTRLAGWFDALRGEVAQLQRQLQELSAGAPEERLGRAQRVLAWVLRGLLLAMVLAVVVLGVLGYREMIGTSTMWAWIAVVVVVWVLASFITFVLLQREVFREMHRRQHSDDLEKVLLANLRMALEDLEALGHAYGQFDRWALILTRFLGDPFGLEDESESAAPGGVVLPEGMSTYELTAPRPELEAIAAELRARRFSVGWLARAWESFEKTLEEDLTADQMHRLRQAHGSVMSTLLSSPAREGSELSLWSRAVQEHGVRSDHGEQIWEECLAQLVAQPPAALRIQRPAAEGGDADSLETLRRELETSGSAQIVQDVLAPGSRTVETRAVDPARSWRAEDADGLGATLVLVQSTAPVAPDDFAYHEAAAAAPIPRSDDDLIF